MSFLRVRQRVKAKLPKDKSQKKIQMGPVKKTERSPSLCIRLSRKEFSSNGPRINPIKKGAIGIVKYLKIRPNTPAKSIIFTSKKLLLTTKPLKKHNTKIVG